MTDMTTTQDDGPEAAAKIQRVEAAYALLDIAAGEAVDRDVAGTIKFFESYADDFEEFAEEARDDEDRDIAMDWADIMRSFDSDTETLANLISLYIGPEVDGYAYGNAMDPPHDIMSNPRVLDGCQEAKLAALLAEFPNEDDASLRKEIEEGRTELL